MDSGLSGKVVFVTGASGGIGRALAEAFAAEGALLVLQGQRRYQDLERLVADRPWRERALCLRADVTDAQALEAAFESARTHFGRVDVCVANAGVWPPEELPLQHISEERLREVVAVDLLGAAFTARAFMRCLEESGPRPDGHGAALIFTGSTAGVFGERGHADYAMSKAGLVGLVRTLKNEITALDPGARVNLVHPGWTVTSMARPALEDDGAVRRALGTMAMRQLGRAEDVAHAALFLASPLLSRHISGECLVVAGGMEGRLLWEGDEIDVEGVRASAGAQATAADVDQR